GNDIFIDEVGRNSNTEFADIFVSSDFENFTFLGRAGEGSNAFDLSTIGFTQPVTAVRIVGLDNGGDSPGFDVINVEVPNSSLQSFSNQTTPVNRVFNFFDSGAGPIDGPYGGIVSGGFPVPVSTDVVLGRDSDSVTDFLSLPTDSFVIVGFDNQIIIDGLGDDVIIRNTTTTQAQADVFVTSDFNNYEFLGGIQGEAVSTFDLSNIGFTQPVRGIAIVGLDNDGGSPGYDLASVEVPNSSLVSQTTAVNRVFQFSDSGAGPIAGPYGGILSGDFGDFPIPVSTDVVLGKDSDALTQFLSLPTDSFVTVGFDNQTIIDSPGDDIIIRNTTTTQAQADVFVTSDFNNYEFLGGIQGEAVSTFDLSTIGLTEPVRGITILGLDNDGNSPGYDLASVEVFNSSLL
ncbi:hypothetical protein, partial [Okeania sp.]|uniref:hypothetical protein n=1 Tax=Okeania sp. TaxID=3100323 RepID=UPI002B4B1C7B